MTTITITQLQDDLAGWLRRVSDGETLRVVGGDADPETIAEITKPERPIRRQRAFGSAAGEFTVFDDFDDPLPDDIINSFYGE